MQLRLLKKLFDVPQSVSSSFLFLELGVLPIEYEIQKRQLTFLHHIVNLDSNDPVRLLYDQMKRLPCEANWVNDVRRSADKFSIEIDDEQLRTISKDTFKNTVKKAVEAFAFKKLQTECSQQKKTQTLKYDHFRCQPYLTKLYPSQAKVILKCRARCLKIKTHRPFLFKNKICRWCNLEEESLEHVINCGSDDSMKVDVSIDDLGECDYDMELRLTTLSGRINDFLDMVEI